MLILPAIDLREGRCVRLLQGRFDAVSEYGDPFAQVRAFADAGAEWIHIVDLDGARVGQPAQHDLIGELARASGLKVQSGGGIRSTAHVETLLDAGVARVVVGSVAARDPEAVSSWIERYGAERICAAFDVRGAGETWEVAADGWASASGETLDEMLERYGRGGLRHILVTDIGRDGALSGPNLDLVRWVRAARPDLALQASGGVSALEDLSALSAAGASAAIIGRALYEKRFTLEDALAL
jgi:phosphoribosylformimino-5-aminoimidazole carboxamide ribotide isomerase